jgi:hypothetical protein
MQHGHGQYYRRVMCGKRFQVNRSNRSRIRIIACRDSLKPAVELKFQCKRAPVQGEVLAVGGSCLGGSSATVK